MMIKKKEVKTERESNLQVKETREFHSMISTRKSRKTMKKMNSRSSEADRESKKLTKMANPQVMMAKSREEVTGTVEVVEAEVSSRMQIK